MISSSQQDKEIRQAKLGVAAIGGLIVFVFLLVGIISGIARCGPGEACIVRNGGWFDDKGIRKQMEPGGNIQAVGFFSQVRRYRSSDNQSQYRITAEKDEGDKVGVDFVQVPTKDGVLVRLEATTFFTTAFTGGRDDKLLREFDVRFGNRKFKDKRVWDGEKGYAAWQEVVFRPLLNNAIRATILTFNCDDLISSCSVVRAGGRDISVVTKGKDNSRNFQRVGIAIVTRLRENIRKSLRSGGSDETFLTNISFKLEDVKLPKDLQTQINKAQEANAKISEARAENEQSKLEAERNRRLAASYKSSPELKEVRIAELYAKAGADVTVIQGGATPLIRTGK